MSTNTPDEIPEDSGPYHDFWLLREGERAYKDYRDLLIRKDAPIRLADYLEGFLYETFGWIPSINPSNPDPWPGFGLNKFGPTVINKQGGAQLSRICQGWALIISQGPETLILRNGSLTRKENELPSHFRFKTARDPLVQAMETLAEWGEKAATGEFFILHLGI